MMETKLVLLGTGTPNACRMPAVRPLRSLLATGRTSLISVRGSSARRRRHTGTGSTRFAGQAGDRVLHTPAHGSHGRIPGPDLYPMGPGAERTTPAIWTERDPGI